MELHVVVGASAIGLATARLLAERGNRVKIITRSGSGPAHPNIERIAADATDADLLATMTKGAVALYSCANPPYDRWLKDWPALWKSVLSAAEKTGVVLAIQSTLYGYGQVDGPMTEESPLMAQHPKLRIRAKQWEEALVLHKSGRLKVVEVRASDFIQPNSFFSLVLAKPLVAGKKPASVYPIDHARTWTSVNDAAELLLRVAKDPEAWGKAWHVPSNPPITARQLLSRFAEVNQLRPAKPTVLPYPLVWAIGLFVPILRELRVTYYQHSHPFVMDSETAKNRYGLTPEPIESALREVLELLPKKKRR